jgi:uncharacterized membrane-anchored protein YhcB (DUF1043 family)
MPWWLVLAGLVVALALGWLVVAWLKEPIKAPPERDRAQRPFAPGSRW